MRKSIFGRLLPNKAESSPLPQAGRVLVALFIISLAGSLFILFTVYLPSMVGNEVEAVFTIIIAVTSLVSIFLLRRGHMQVAATVFITLVGIFATTTALDDNGLRNATISLFFIIIATSSVYLGSRGVIVTTGLLILSTGFIYFGELTGILTIPYSGDVTLDVWIAIVIALGATGMILEFSRRHSQSTLELFEQQNREFTVRNIELENIKSSLEETIQERTASLERRARYLEAAAEVGRAATSIYNQDELLSQVVLFVSERFNFYQVGIFLLDELHEFAILRAASSEGGQNMIARGHRLKVGQEGIVGYVTGTGQARIALDVGEDAIHFDNPELPNTRSEMALPLFFGGRLVGAIDVQSTEPGAFLEDDISALRVLADQVSMAINNAQLFQQLQDSVESERRAYGDLSRSAWQEMLHKGQIWGYRYFQNQTLPTQGGWSTDMVDAVTNQKVVVDVIEGQPTLALPLSIGDQSLGAIRVRKGTGLVDWTDDEIDLLKTLTNRLSQTLETARLFQATQKQAAQEQITSEISTNIRQTLNIDDVLRTAARELGETFKAKEVVIRMKSDDSTN